MPGPRPPVSPAARPAARHPRSPWSRLRQRPHRHPRGLLRPGAAAALAAAVAVSAAGCARFDATFGQQEAVVQFKPGTSKATRLQVRAACSHIAQVRPEALPTDHLASDQLYDVRYQVGGASDAQLARLQQCLEKHPSVVGINFSTPGGN
ncbi:MAG: hypothetical protein ACM32E_32160 [Gemmatimonadota bacterium]